MNMKDYPMIFEEVVRHFWKENSDLEVYYSNYFALCNLKTRGILYSILVYEINHNKEKYALDILNKMKEFEEMEWDLENLKKENIQIIDFLYDLIYTKKAP